MALLQKVFSFNNLFKLLTLPISVGFFYYVALELIIKQIKRSIKSLVQRLSIYYKYQNQIMKKMKFVLAAFSTMIAVNSFSQAGGVPRPSLSIGVEGALPMGDFNKGYNMGIGGSAKFAFPVAPDLDLTLNAGYISHSGKTIVANFKNPTVNLIPIKAGVRYHTAAGIFIEPQLGYTNFKYKGSDNSSSAFTYAANVGYALSKGVDFGVRYEAFSKNEVTTSFIGARLGYSFGL
jgi:hypothetical protein